MKITLSPLAGWWYWGFWSRVKHELLPELFGVILLNLGSLFDKLQVSVQQIQSALSVSLDHVMLVLQTHTIHTTEPWIHSALLFASGV